MAKNGQSGTKAPSRRDALVPLNTVHLAGVFASTGELEAALGTIDPLPLIHETRTNGAPMFRAQALCVRPVRSRTAVLVLVRVGFV